MKEWQYEIRNQAWIKQHSVNSITETLDNALCKYSQVKHGDIKKGEGNIVIVNVDISKCKWIYEWLQHTRDIQKIEQIGRFTNIYFGNQFYNMSIKNITKEL